MLDRMPTVRLAGTDVSVSRFVFGTSSLFNVGSQRNRLALLEAAVENGFTHFDTAPYYGFGWAERDLGLLLRRHTKLSVTTKVGLYSPGGEDASRVSVLARKALGRLFSDISRPTVDFSLRRAQNALTMSLQRLGIERVSIYLLHDPHIDLLQTDEWQRWLEAEVVRGRVGTFGIALTRDRLMPLLERAPDFPKVIQLADSLDRREADCLELQHRPFQLTYGYVSAAMNRNNKINVAEVLCAALQRNQKGAIIVSTTKIKRVSQYGAIARQTPL